MANSLRADVEWLARSLVLRADEDTAKDQLITAAEKSAISHKLRQLLARHPHADGVSVPRDLFKYMRGFMDEKDRGFQASATEAEFTEIRERSEQADAILSAEGKA